MWRVAGVGSGGMNCGEAGTSNQASLVLCVVSERPLRVFHSQSDVCQVRGIW